MTIRGTLFLLFLYLLLAWILVFLRFRDQGLDVTVQYGLVASAIGVGGLFAWMLLERVLGWWRLRRLRARPKPQVEAPPARPVHEDDAAFAALIAEADERLANATAGPKRGVRELPIYLLVGPAGAGKTSLVHNAGIDAQLLAGSVLGGGHQLAPTRVANIWLANNCIFIEISGRIFQSETDRFAEFLKVLRPDSATKGWKNIWKPERPPAPAIRGVLLCNDVRHFMGTSDPSKFESAAQTARERLLAVATAFDLGCPVYALFTRVDAVPYFAEFFAKFPEAEADQPFGALAAPEAPQTDGRVWTESETKRLSRDFSELFLGLNKRRILALSHESSAQRKPQVYEFPREFKRIRTPIVQFLVDAFRPDRLRLNPMLRGFFFCGTRQAEQRAEARLESSPSTGRERGSMEATRIFRQDATQVFSQTMAETAQPSRGHVVDRWVFTKEIFQEVLQKDRPAVAVASLTDHQGERRRIIAATAVAGTAFFLSILWTNSWLGNRSLVEEVRASFVASGKTSQDVTLENLRGLDQLRRLLVERLDHGGGLGLNWGLYVGDRLREAVRSAYFSRLRGLLLDRANARLIDRMRRVDAAQQYDAIYNRIQTHLTIAGRQCDVDVAIVGGTLKETAVELQPDLDENRRALLDRQIDYYLNALRVVEPVELPRDDDAVNRARAWLNETRGPEQIYRALVAEVHASASPVTLRSRVADYQQVISAPAEVAFEFTREGRQRFEGLADTGKFSVAGKPCVVGKSGTSTLINVDQVRKVKSLYYRAYLEAWKTFLANSSVKRFDSPQDAAGKLEILTGTGKPLLGLIRFVGDNTFVPVTKTPAPSQSFDKLLSPLKAAEKSVEKAATKAGLLNPMELSPHYISQIFQPAHLATQPEAPNLVTEQNKGYVEALRSAQQSLERYARASDTERPPLIQPIHDALGEASKAALGLADGFNKNTEGVNKTVSELLLQPVKLARWVVPSNPDKAAAEALRAKVKGYCAAIQPVLTKYPFNRKSEEGVSLVELTRVFSPAGAIWQPWLAELFVKNDTGWAPKPDAKLHPSPEFLNLLNRSQELTGALFVPGSEGPRLSYELRAGKMPAGVTIELIADGTQLAPVLRTRFTWPAPKTAAAGASLSEVSGPVSSGAGKYSGLWGVFRLFGFADERPLRSREVTWSKNYGQQGEPQPLQTPVRIDITDFPGGADLLNPKFFEQFKCNPGQLLAVP